MSVTPQQGARAESEAICYRLRRPGERKYKSVCRCIVSANLSVLNLTTVKIKEIPRLTDTSVSQQLESKGASRIRKLFNL